VTKKRKRKPKVPSVRKQQLATVRKEATIQEYDQKAPYTYVVLNCNGFIGVGFSKCRPGDPFDPAIGKEIAVGRAALSIAKAQFWHEEMVGGLEDTCSCECQKDATVAAFKKALTGVGQAHV
jgi:hypothetical protein